jgi:hypothetical protein
MADGPVFCVVADATYYLGAVALLNSLRLSGHEEPFVVVDAGLSPSQRKAIAEHSEVVRGVVGQPGALMKWAGASSRAADPIVVLDADVVVVRSLEPLLERARRGDVVAFLDDQPDRHHEGWGAALGLGEVPRRPYVNAGFLALPGATAAAVLPLVELGQRRIRSEPTRASGGTRADPFYLPDQDVWNAVLAARVPPEHTVALPRRLAPFAPYPGVRLLDARLLDIGHEEGVRPFLLHQVGPKPWQRRLRPNVYSRLLARLLLGEDLTLRPDPRTVPYWLGEGVRSRARAVLTRFS